MTSAAASLRTMKILATSLLIFMALVFGVSKYFESVYPWLAPLVAFSEAALIGSLADWFAVVAIFRHPLGLPIPHTAIIPRNKERIAVNLGEFIENNFLSSSEANNPAAVKLLEQISEWLRTDQNSSLVAERLLLAAESFLSSLSDEQLQIFVEHPLRQQLKSLNLSAQLSRVIGSLLERHQEQILLDEGLLVLERVLSEDNSWLHQALVKTLPWFIPEFVSDKLSNEGIKRVVEVLHDIKKDSSHPARTRFRAALQDLAIQLTEDPQYHQKISLLRDELLQSDLLNEATQEVRTFVRERAPLLIRERQHELVPPIAKWIESQAEKIASDRQLQLSLVHLIVRALQIIVSRGSDKIAEGIAHTVRSWDTRTLVTKLEQQVGRDLQFVRINGTIVGGLVGLLLYFLSNLSQ